MVQFILSWVFAKKRAFLAMVMAMAVLTGVAVAGSGGGVMEISYDKLAKSGVKPEEYKVTLDPTRGWTPSNVYVKKGDLVSIAASGLVDPGVRIMRGPEGQGKDHLKEMVHSCPYVALLARIGDGQPVCVGASATYEIVEGGHIYFHINELEVLRFDDSGHFDIVIKVVRVEDAEKSVKGKTGKAVTATLPLVPTNMKYEDTVDVSAALRGHLADTGNYIMVDDAQVQQARRKLKMNYSEQADAKKAVRIAKEAGADTVVFGQISRIGNSYSVTLQKADVATGKIENTVVENYECSLRQLPAKIKTAAEKL